MAALPVVVIVEILAARKTPAFVSVVAASAGAMAVGVAQSVLQPAAANTRACTNRTRGYDRACHFGPRLRKSPRNALGCWRQHLWRTFREASGGQHCLCILRSSQ